MGFTYAKDNSNLSLLRFTIGDTDEQRQMFDDAELNVILDNQTTVIALAGALALEAKAAELAREYDFTADGASFFKSQQATAMTKAAARLRRLGTGTTSVPVIRKDGYSQDVKSDAANTDTASSFDRSGLVN